MKTNERLFKLQRQLDMRAQHAAKAEKELNDDINARIEKIEGDTEHKLNELE